MKYIEIVGVMGTGKSSLARLFNTHANCHIIAEQEHDLENLYFLKEYLSDPVKYGFEGALNFMGYFVNLIQHNVVRMPKDATAICDVSLLSQYAYSKGNLPEKEMKIINDIIRTAYTKVPPVDLRIVTTLPIDINLRRIKARGRDFEANVPVEHLIKTASLMDEAIEKFGAKVPTIRVDGSKQNWCSNENDKRDILILVQQKLGLWP